MEHKTQVNATCNSSGPAHSSHYNCACFGREAIARIQRSLAR